jgi:photosystem II stability/assembly factor-like uncharacterized protein
MWMRVWGVVGALLWGSQAVRAHQPHDPMVTIAVSPNFAQDHTAFAASSALTIKIGVYLLFKSTDGGATWAPVANLPGNAKISAIAFSPNYSLDQTIFLAGIGGLYRSTDQGNTWSLQSSTQMAYVAVSASFATDNTLFVASLSQTIFKSTDRGQTFQKLATPTTLTSPLTVMAVSPNYDADKTLLLGSYSNGIFLSNNGGSSWLPVTKSQKVATVTALNFSPGFATDRTAFAATLGTGVLISRNGGKSWAGANTGIADLNVSSLSLSPGYLQDAAVWITTGKAGVYQTTTLGVSWTQGAPVPRSFSGLSNVHYMYVVPATGGTSSALLFLAMYEGLWSSSNGGASWLYIDTIPTRTIRYVNLPSTYATKPTVFVSTYGGGNTWSQDGGMTWSINNLGMQSPYTDASGISPNFAADGTAFSAMDNGLQRSTDWGMTWQVMNALGAVTYPRSLAVSPNYANDSTVLIGTDNGDSQNYPIYVTYQGQQYYNQGLFLSIDGGDNWMPTSLNGPAVISIAMSPAFATDRTAFASSPTDGLFKSTDGGMTWTQVTLPGGTTLQMGKVAMSPSYASDQTVLVAPVVTGGIYKSTNGGASWSLLNGTATLRALDIAFSPNYAADQSFFVGTVQKGLLEFTQGGATMLPVPVPDTCITAVIPSPNLLNDQTLFAAGYHGLFKSTNSGTNWTYTAEPARVEESRQANSSYQPEDPPSLTYQGMWAGIYPFSNASSEAYMTTSEAQDTVVFNFTGTAVRWVGQTGPTQGMAAIQLDGVSQGTVNLYAAVNANQQTLWKQSGFPCGVHTLTITALPQSGQSINLDAFDVWITGCPNATGLIP